MFTGTKYFLWTFHFVTLSFMVGKTVPVYGLMSTIFDPQ